MGDCYTHAGISGFIYSTVKFFLRFLIYFSVFILQSILFAFRVFLVLFLIPLVLIECLYIMQTHRKMPKDQKTVSESPPSEIEALVPVEPRPYGTFNTVWSSFVFLQTRKSWLDLIEIWNWNPFIFYNPLNTTSVIHIEQCFRFETFTMNLEWLASGKV